MPPKRHFPCVLCIYCRAEYCMCIYHRTHTYIVQQENYYPKIEHEIVPYTEIPIVECVFLQANYTWLFRFMQCMFLMNIQECCTVNRKCVEILRRFGVYFKYSVVFLPLWKRVDVFVFRSFKEMKQSRRYKSRCGK